jgi:hypothetical protein
MMSEAIRLSDLFKYYKQGLPHQTAAVQLLEEQIMKTAPEVMSRENEWFKIWSQTKKQEPAKQVVLSVPYEWQRDNKSGTGWRECFSSSSAMVAKFYGKVDSDDEYNAIRARYGDSTDASAQLKTLHHLGLKAEFSQKMSVDSLQKELRAGRPVPVGWLHHDNYRKPSGGGHWSVAVGFDDLSIIHNDPYGMADIVNGGYTSGQGGKCIHYGKKYWLPRWTIEGPSSGWALLINK